MCEKSSMKTPVKEEAACNLTHFAASDVTQWQSYIVGNVGGMF